MTIVPKDFPNSRTRRRSVRWWAAVLLGMVVSVPIGWVLSLAGTLPFFLGPFFFALLGLVIGAAVHRVACIARPYGRVTLWLGTMVLVLFCWGISLVKESRDFPEGAAISAARKTRFLGTDSVQEYRRSVADGIRRYLRENYPPGGTLGYVRWVAANGQIDKGEISGVHRTLRSAQQGAGWVVRVVLSLSFLTFGIASQTLTLRNAHDPIARAKDVKGGGSEH